MFSVIEGDKVTAMNIAEACKLDEIVYDEIYRVELEKCLDWYHKNKKIYTMIQDDNTKRIIAYVNVSPITEEYYEKIINGDYIDAELPSDAIVSYDIPDRYYAYFSSIVIHPDYQKTEVFMMLFDAITQKFIRLGEDGIFIDRIVADAVSDKGVKFCKLFGMKEQRSSSHHSQIYEVRMLPPEFRVSSKATSILYNYYSQKASELGLLEEKKEPRSAPARGEEHMKNNELNDFDVFISYASNDKDVADRVCNYLETNGVQCWIAPRNINAGGSYASQIVHAIRNCKILVLLASENTNVSGHVSNEVSLAFDNKKTIIPFKMENIVFSDDYLYYLGRQHWIEAHLDMEQGLSQLLSTVMEDMDQGAPSKKEVPNKKNTGIRMTETVVPKQEKNDTGVTKEQIIEQILRNLEKYPDNHISILIKNGQYDMLKEYANEAIKRSFKVYHYNKRIEPDNYIDQLVDELLGDDDAEVIKISGRPGTGKNILMQCAFYQVMMEYEKGNTKYLPFYISLEYFEKIKYTGENIYDQAKESIKKELEEYLSFINTHPTVFPVLFIDDVREHFMGKTPLENVLMDVLQEINVKKRVVSIDSGLIKMKNRNKKVITIVSERVSSWFESVAIDIHHERIALEFIKSVLDFYQLSLDAKEVFRVIKKLKYKDLDMFIVRSIADEMMSSPNEIINIADLYTKWALTELNGDEDKLMEISSLAFDYIYDPVFNLNNISFNQPIWRLFHKDASFIDYLISHHMMKEIERSAETNEPDDYDFLKIMLTSSTDAFLAGYLYQNHLAQERIFKIITENYDRFEIVQKSSATFWLSKLTYKNLVTDSTEFLKERYDEIKKAVKTCDNTTQDNYDQQFYFRALCYTLIGLKQTQVLDDYICLLITNNSSNEINRGATIEYFSDQYQMAANESFNTDSDISAGENAINTLSWKIVKKLEPDSKKYVELDLVTYCMLIQRRIQSNESEKVPEVMQWTKDAVKFIRQYQIRPRSIKSEKIQFYFKSISNDFERFSEGSGNFDISQYMYDTLKRLRDVKRKQWVERGIEDPESVSEHSYNAWLMAMLFLPEELDYEDYSKKEIMDMLLVHDMAESKLGDQVLALNEPSKQLRSQNEIMRMMMVKGTYPNISNLTYYYNIWTGYFNGVNINAKIARDINLIQSVYTFFEYVERYPEKFEDEDIKKWKNEKGNIETGIGYQIFEKLVENNANFKHFN